MVYVISKSNTHPIILPITSFIFSFCQPQNKPTLESQQQFCDTAYSDITSFLFPIHYPLSQAGASNPFNCSGLRIISILETRGRKVLEWWYEQAISQVRQPVQSFVSKAILHSSSALAIIPEPQKTLRQVSDPSNKCKGPIWRSTRIFQKQRFTGKSEHPAYVLDFVCI